MPRRDGIDVSYAQGIIDWAKVGSLGMRWGATKATEGSGYVDKPWLATNRAALALYGFRYRGLYHWLRLDSAVSSQVAHFLRAVGPLAPGEFVMLDAETDQATGRDPTAENCQAWCEGVEAVTGRPVVVYTGVFVDGGRIAHMAVHTNRPLVIAAYVDEHVLNGALVNAGLPKPAAWRWIGTGGTCPGVAGDVDCDQINDPAAFDLSAGLTGGSSRSSRMLSGLLQEDDMTPEQDARLARLEETVSRLDLLVTAMFQQLLTPYEVGAPVAGLTPRWAIAHAASIHPATSELNNEVIAEITRAANEEQSRMSAPKS